MCTGLVLVGLLSAAAPEAEGPPAPPPLPEGRVVLSHIFLWHREAPGVPPAVRRTREESRAVLEKVRPRLLAAPDLWDALMHEYSDDKASLSRGGKVGVFQWRDLPAYVGAEAALALAALPHGAFSPVLDSPRGTHIFLTSDAVRLGAAEILIGFKESTLPAHVRTREFTRSREEAAAVAAVVAREARRPGADFDALARQHSDVLPDPERARTFVMYRHFTALPEAAEALAKVENGAIAGPVATVYGYHVLLRLPAEMRARWIVIRWAQGANDAARRSEEDARVLAEDILGRLSRDEAAFADLAVEYSEDERTAAAGGALGEIDLTFLPDAPPAARAVFALASGQVSGVLKAPGFFCIVRREPDAGAGGPGS